MTTAATSTASQSKPSGAFKRWFISFLICVVAIGGLTFFKVQEIMAAIAFGQSFPEPSATIEAHEVKFETYRPKIRVTGELVAPRRLELHNEISGTIVAVGFESGSAVKAGQLLVQLDDREEKARKKALTARRTLAQREFNRNEKLLAQGRVSEKAVDESRAELDTVNAELEQLNVLIGKKRIVAPFAASTGIHQFEVGQLLSVNTKITTLIGITPTLWFDFELPQRISALEIGETVTILREGKEPISATIIAKAAELSGGSRSLRYRAEFLVEGSDLMPQAFVSAEVPLGTAISLAQIPDTALRTDQLGDFVYVLKPETKSDAGGEVKIRAHRQSVVVKGRSKNIVTLASGLAEGDLVGARGAFKLKENLLVNIIDKTALSETSSNNSEKPNQAEPAL